MPKFTPQQLDKLYQQALAEFAASPEKWRNFLDTAARLTAAVINDTDTV